MYRIEVRIYEQHAAINVHGEYERQHSGKTETIALTADKWHRVGSSGALSHLEILRYAEGVLSRIAQKLDVPLF